MSVSSADSEVERLFRIIILDAYVLQSPPFNITNIHTNLSFFLLCAILFNHVESFFFVFSSVTITN